MFSIVPPQTGTPTPTPTPTTPNTTTTNIFSYKPVISSPLAKSSPPRPTSPLSPLAASFGNRQPPQSSPVRGPAFGAAATKSRFAGRPVKPLPFARNRDEAQQGRRQQFIQGGRQRARDLAWQRRDIEGFTYRQSLLQDTLRYRTQSMSMDTTDQDIEDAATFASAQAPQPPESWDEMMADDVARYEEMELNARLAGMEDAREPAYMMDDADFDEALMGLVDEVPGEKSGAADGMDMS